jgi:predicted nucleic acid-binding protein
LARIIDASVAVALFTHGERTVLATPIFASNVTLLAPDVLVAETTNALRTYQRIVKSSRDDVDAFLERLCERVRLVPSCELVRTALVIADDLNHPAYDAFYLALALRDGAQFVTFDDRLKRKVGGTKYESLVFKPRFPQE